MKKIPLMLAAGILSAGLFAATLHVAPDGDGESVFRTIGAAAIRAQPGDVILFDWGGDGVCDHVGVVEKNFGSYVQTIEGNTSSGSSGSQSNGGGVYRRTRAWSTVKAVVRPNYGSSSGTTTTTKPSTSTSARLKVDGYIGKNSTTEWQTQLGCDIIDGVISGQNSANKEYLYRLTSITWEGTGQSGFVKKLQQFLVNKGYSIKVDGFLGPKTVVALQQFLRDYCGYVKHGIDGYLGPNTAANVQNALNAGYFKM